MNLIYDVSKIWMVLTCFVIVGAGAAEGTSPERATSKLSREQLSEMLVDIYTGPERVAKQFKVSTKDENGPSEEDLEVHMVASGASYNAFQIAQLYSSDAFHLSTPETYVPNFEEGRLILFFMDCDEGGNMDRLVCSEKLNPKNRIGVFTNSKDSPFLKGAHDTVVVSSPLKEQSWVSIGSLQRALYLLYTDFNEPADYVFRGVGNDMSAVVESEQTSQTYKNLGKITLGSANRIFTLGSKKDSGYGLAMEQARLLRETSTKPIECRNIDDLSDDFDHEIKRSDAIILFITFAGKEENPLKEKVSELAARFRDKTTRIIIICPNTTDFAFWGIRGTKIGVPPAKDAFTWNRYGYLKNFEKRELLQVELEQIQNKDFGICDWIKGAIERAIANEAREFQRAVDKNILLMVCFGIVSPKQAQSPSLRSAVRAQDHSMVVKKSIKMTMQAYFDDWQDELLNSYGRVFSMGVVAQLLAYHHAMALLESGRG